MHHSKMGSSYFGEPNMGNEIRGSSSTRKCKKSSSEKPKQPQRGLGVAQLEKIRLHGQMASTTTAAAATYLPLPLHHHHHHHPHGPYASNFNQEDHNMRVQACYSMASSSSSSSPSSVSCGFQYPNMMTGLGEYEQRANIRYGDSKPSTTTSWNPSSGILESQHFVQPNMTRQLLHVEDSYSKRSKKHRSNSLGSSSQNSESSDAQELDLELRLSL